jgi:hypothetical protein
MRHIKPRQSFLDYLEGRKLIEVIEEGNTTTPLEYDNKSAYSIGTSTPDTEIIRLRELVELTREYRKWQKAYFAKLKRKEFAKDEQHFMMKYQEKIDQLLKNIKL